MFKVAYSLNNNRRRKVQHGIRDLTMTKWKCFYRAFVVTLSSMCTVSSFTPLRFAFRSKRLKMDVFLWISITITLTVLTAIFIHNFLTKFYEMSTRTYVGSQQQNVAHVNFPSVTVCATSSYPYTKVYGFLHTYIIENPILRSSVNLTKILKTFSLAHVTVADFEEIDVVLTAHNITMQDVLYHTAQDCDELLQRCKWQDEVRSCSQLFRKILVGGSFCCSFNYVDKPNTGKHLKTASFERGHGLSFITRPIKDKFFRRADYGRNIKIILNPSITFPLSNEYDILAPMRKETNVELDSVYNAVNQNILQLPIEYRGCISFKDRTLLHFQWYSYSNCILQCRISKIIRACGCATYFYPSGNDTICPASKLLCTIQNDYLGANTNEDGTISVENCDCPADCSVERLRYRVQSTRFVHNNFTVDAFYDGLSDDNGIVHINYSKSFVKLLRRKLLLDRMELASYVGGIFALFLGSSIMSIFEIVYFLSFRLFANYRRLCIQNCLVHVPIYLE